MNRRRFTALRHESQSVTRTLRPNITLQALAATRAYFIFLFSYYYYLLDNDKTETGKAKRKRVFRKIFIEGERDRPTTIPVFSSPSRLLPYARIHYQCCCMCNAFVRVSKSFFLSNSNCSSTSLGGEVKKRFRNDAQFT